MKKIKIVLLAIICIISVLLLSACNNYDEIKEALNGQTFYCNGGTDNSLSGLIFNGDEVTVKNVYFDGNGKHDGEENTYEYTLDKENIIITEDLVVPYTFENDTIVLGASENVKSYFTEDEVHQALKGYWNSTTAQYLLGSLSRHQYNILIDETTITYEYAALAYNTENSYYYYGPFSGEYTLNFGGFDSDVKNGHSFFFNIIDGKVVLLHYDDICTESDGLPGENGYHF